MNIYFRTNYNTTVGIGNFMRVVMLAEKLKKKHTCIIILDKKINEFKNLNLKFDHLYNNDLEFESQETDAKIFISKVKRGSIIFVDDYRLGNKWEKIVTKKSKKLIGICDDYKKKHYVDFLINTKPLLDIKHKKTYQNIKQVNKKNCKFLFGHKYAFIKKFSKQVKSDKKNFTITFYNGGSGDLVIYLKLIKLIIINKRLIDKIIQIKVIIGPMSKNKKKTVEIFAKINGIKIIRDKLDIREQLVRTDLMISSSGLMFYESSYYKIPTIFIKMVDNQDIDNYSVQNFGQIVVLDKKDLNQTQKMKKLIFLLINNNKRLKNYISKPKFIVDSNGPSRIINKILK